MALVPVSTSLYLNISWYSSISIIILTISVSIYHVISTVIHYKESDSDVTPSIKLSSLLIIFAITIPILWLFQTQFCNQSHYILISLYIIYKLIWYLMLVLRAFEAYEKSPVTFHTKTLKIWAIILIVWSLFNLISQIFTTSAKINNDKICILTFHPFITISLILLNIVACIGNWYLYVKPIYILYFQTHDFYLKTICIKQCILVGIAILTTIITISFIFIFDLSQLFITLDVLVATICVILMYGWNRKIVGFLCCCCYYPADVSDKKPEG